MPIKTINNPRFQEFDDAGAPLDGGKLYTYIAGTTTNKATYSDIELVTPNANPIILDSRGEATIFGQGAYKFVLTDSADVEKWTVDNITASQGGNTAARVSIGDYGDDLTVALSTIGSAETTLVIDKQVTLTASDTVPSTIALEFTRNGSFTAGAPYTLTINGSFYANKHQIFDSSNVTVVLGQNSTSTVYPEWWGAFPDNATDYGTELQASLDAMVVGSEWIISPGVYLTSNRLVYKPRRTYRGINHSGEASVIKQADNSNISDGIFVSEGFINSSIVADERVIMRDFLINGNKTNNASAATAGILATNYYSIIENITVFETKGDGIRFDDTYLSTSTAVGNKILNNKIIKPDGHGIYIEANFFTDGEISGNEIGNPAKDGIRNLRAAGWNIHDNYIYGAEENGIYAAQGWNLSIGDNKIDGWGYSTTTGTYYCIAIFNAVDDKPCMVSNNTINMNEANVVVGTTYTSIFIGGTTGNTTAQLTIANNNVFFGASATSKFLEAGGAGSGEIFLSGNQVKGADVSILHSTIAWVVAHQNNSFDNDFQTLAGSGTPSVLQGKNFKTGSTNITYSNFDDGYEGQEIKVIFDFAPGTGFVDFTGTNLKGNGGVDWVFAVGDHMTCVHDGTNWYCDISDNTV